eukprot:5561590-Pyramimonas_sp.AAC.1
MGCGVIGILGHRSQRVLSTSSWAASCMSGRSRSRAGGFGDGAPAGHREVLRRGLTGNIEPDRRQGG